MNGLLLSTDAAAAAGSGAIRRPARGRRMDHPCGVERALCCFCGVFRSEDSGKDGV